MDRTGISGYDKKEEYAEINLCERDCEKGWQDMINAEIFRQLAEHLPYGKHTVRIELIETHEDDKVPFYLVSVIASH